MIRINNISLSLDSSEDKLVGKAARMLNVSPASIKRFEIVRKAVDARNKSNVFFVYTLDVEIDNPEKYVGMKNVDRVEASYCDEAKTDENVRDLCRKIRPMVIGAGPAGLFAALTLAEAGLNPIIIERGAPVQQRTADVDLFWKTGRLNSQSNVQFGEGGAGTFSDGKLTTGIKNSRIPKIIDALLSLGAPGEIKYLAKPHIGTDKLIGILINMRKKIEGLGGEYRFNTRLKDLNIEGECLRSVVLEDLSSGKESEEACDAMILAIGHSARDTFEMLERKGIQMESKPFSVGVRIEHKQSDINKAQYGKFWAHPKLGAADYKLSVNGAGRGVYTFCMCPGGQVVAAASEEGRLTVNGMSLHARDAKNANSAVLVSVSPSDFPGDGALKGMYFQREIEERAFALGGGNYFAPVQLVGDFLQGRSSREIGDIQPSYKPGYELMDLRECLPEFVAESLKDAIFKMGSKLQNFDKFDAVLTAVESRSSSPVRIYRGNSYESSVPGLIPCGEGAGYAGGIMSACVDGVVCAESLIKLVDRRGISK